MRSNAKPRPQAKRRAWRSWLGILMLSSLIFLLPPATAWTQSTPAPSPPPAAGAPSAPESWLPEGWLLLTEADLQEIVGEAVAKSVQVAVAEERALRVQAVEERDGARRLVAEATRREAAERAKVRVLAFASGGLALATAVLGILLGIHP